MYLIRELLGLQLVEIGSAFGGRDHSTVIHSVEKVGDEIGTDPAFMARVEKLRARLKALRE
jgi:chromosomal replication initiator protein